MITQRRQVTTAGILLVSLIAPLLALAGSWVLDNERIANYWTVAVLSSETDAVITEAIDYDFGLKSRRGIFRTIPDLDRELGVVVTSATAPDDTQISFGSRPSVRIGNPRQTIRGRHRYVLQYSLDTLERDSEFSWNAIGTEWDVGISSAEIHVISDRELLDPRCDVGRRRSFGGCTAEIVEPGHLMLTTGSLSRGEGITLSAELGPPLSAPPSIPPTPPNVALSSGMSVLIPMAVALVSVLAASPVIGRLVRRQGREQILDTTATSLGFIDDIDSFESYRLADEAEMARLVYPSLDPPRGISAPQGGMLVREGVRPEHKVAWLIEAVTLGEIEMDGANDSDITLRRGSVAPRPTSAARINKLFEDDDDVDLAKYNPSFASAWRGLDDDLNDWKSRSGYWDTDGDSRRVKAFFFGALMMLVGAVAVAVTSGLAIRWSPFLLPLLVGAGLVLGSALTLTFRSWELYVRTPEGTSRWLEVEALRRFISELEPESALNMIEPDRFAGYTPWAIAFGYEDKWKHIIEEIKTDPRFHHLPAQHFYVASMGPSMSRATSTASTAPSSSSSGGGGFSGGVGGGGGGGGGGSW